MTYPGVYVNETPGGVQTINGVKSSATAFVGFTASEVADTPVHITSFAEYEQTFGELATDAPMGYAVKHFFEDGGTEAHVVSVDRETGSLIGNRDAKTGIYALENVDTFNLLVMPDASVGAGSIDVLTTAIEYCVQRRAFMIIDLPEDVSTFQQALTWMTDSASELLSRNAALYFPRICAPDPKMNNAVRTFGCAGALAGLFARTDSQRGIWKAPAGKSAVLLGASDVSVPLNDAENDKLGSLGLNCVRKFPVIGIVSWGARTATGSNSLSDEYKYIPVRRFALFLEESIYRGTQWVVFEPNEEALWAKIRLNIGAFMQKLFTQGAFQGATPKDAYFVKCDNETTTQNDIDLGHVNIYVGFAPLKPAEFVIIRIQQMAGNPAA